MLVDQIPFVSIITFTPLVAAIVLLLMPPEQKTAIRVLAAVAAFITMVLSIALYFMYNQAQGGYQFTERVDWIPQLGISYFVGVDGLSLPMVVLTGIVSFTGVLISWGIDDRPREFFTFFFLLVCGVFGVFVSLDLFLLFFFYELAVFPMYLLIAIWGWQVTREYAAMKLTLYLLIGSVISLVGALAMYFSYTTPQGTHTFDMLQLANAGFSADFQRLWFLPTFLGFAVLAGLWPFHNWSPDGHVAAPTAVSMLHAGVLMKLGAYAALRVGIVLLPDGARAFLPFIVMLAFVNVVYGSFIAMIQRDFKYVIGFSSVSHMGLVSLGFATMTTLGWVGAGLQMFSHGIMTALFFAVVGMVYDRAHIRDIPQLGGMIQKLPWAAVAFIIGGLVSMGMPGLSGFAAELPIFLGAWRAGDIAAWYPVIAVVSALFAIPITAAYVLRVVGRVFFGDLPAAFANIPPITVLDKVAIVILVVLLIGLGVYPAIMANMLESGVRPFTWLLGGT
jgi:NADH-quinone oxidoreductase subunit M